VSEVTIYHNPNCGTSRNVLGLIRNAGIEPTVIEYLKAPPDRQTLLGLIERMGIRVRELLRRKGSPYDELGLDDPKLTDNQLIDAMLANPILINRPIVVTPLGLKLCRPSEIVLDSRHHSAGPSIRQGGRLGLDHGRLVAQSFSTVDGINCLCGLRNLLLN
jgi:arsenate reductase